MSSDGKCYNIGSTKSFPYVMKDGKTMQNCFCGPRTDGKEGTLVTCSYGMKRNNNCPGTLQGIDKKNAFNFKYPTFI